MKKIRLSAPSPAATQQVLKMIPLLLLVLFWQMRASDMQNSLFLPMPSEVVNVIVRMFQSGTLWNHLGASFGRVTMAVLITASIAVPLGVLIGCYKYVEYAFMPIVNLFKYIPVTAFSPLLILMMGIDERMKITFLVIATLFAFLPPVVQEVKSVPVALREKAYTMGFSYHRTIPNVIIPYIFPSVLKTIINLYGVGWTYVIIAEATNAQYGLGHIMYIGSARGQTDTVFAAILIIFAVSLIFDMTMNAIVDHCFSWGVHK